MTSESFVSYAQNAEDVVLHRALGSVTAGRYIEVGTSDPSDHCVTRAFSDRGWDGIAVEPTRRLDDVLVESGWADREIHFVVIDAEGTEADVLAGFELRRWRPWVVVVESTVPKDPKDDGPSQRTWEQGVIGSGYQFCLFDGLARFYVADERARDLRDRLSVPANTFDAFVRYRELEARELAQALADEVIRWRCAAVRQWAEAVSKASAGEEDEKVISALREELDRTHKTVSWRLTSPLRAVRKHRRT